MSEVKYFKSMSRNRNSFKVTVFVKSIQDFSKFITTCLISLVFLRGEE